MATAGVTLEQALDLIQSDRSKDREKGLSDLKNILTLNRNNPELRDRIKEKSVHYTFEALFRVVTSERSVFVKSASLPIRNSSASRLSLCASTLRLSVDVFCPLMRSKTVRAVLGHMTQTLPMADGGFCKPLALDYFKAFESIVSHQPHVEHLDNNAWLDAVEFCIEGIKLFLDDIDHAQVGSGEKVSFDASSTSRSQLSAARKKSSSESRDNAIELVRCLRWLVAASNCHLSGKIHDVLRTSIDFLQSTSSITQAHHSAFATINACLRVLTIESHKTTTWYLELILPLVRQIWPKKDRAVRDELLVTLVLSKPHLAILPRVKSRHEKFSHIIESLLEVLQKEYLESRDVGHLTFESLSLEDSAEKPKLDQSPMHSVCFSLRSSSKESEHNWTVVYLLAFFVNWLDAVHVPSSSVPGSKDRERSPKRRKVTSKLDDLTRSIPNQAEKATYIMQILAFLASQRHFRDNEGQVLFDVLTRYASHESGEVASWAFLGITGIAQNLTRKAHNDDTSWSDIWQLAIRSISAPTTCRAACHTLHMILRTQTLTYSDVFESIDSILSSIALNGPIALSDAALSLCTSFIELDQMQNPNQATKTVSEQMLNWICGKWNPSNLENRSSARQFHLEVSVKALAQAFSVALCHSNTIQNRTHGLIHLGTIGQCWYFIECHAGLLDYLLLDRQLAKPALQDPKISRTPPRSNSGPNTKVEMVAIGFFLNEVEKAMKSWEEAKNDRPASINDDMVHVLFSLCVIVCTTVHTLENSRSKRVEDLKALVHLLVQDIISFSFRSENKRLHNTLLDTIAPFLWTDSSEVDNTLLVQIGEPLGLIVKALTVALAERSDNMNQSQQSTGLDVIGFDFDETVGSRKSTERGGSPLRIDISAKRESFTVYTSFSYYIQLLQTLLDANEQDIESTQIPGTFVEKITSVSPPEFLAIRPLLCLIIDSELELSADGVRATFNYLEENILQSYDWDRCELSICTCADLMIGSISIWADKSFKSLADFGADLYEWLFETILKNGVASSTAQIHMVDLLYKLLEVKPDYAESASTTSVRTFLFNMLSGGAIQVKYSIGQRLSAVFNSFVLAQHEKIFYDIRDNLPSHLDHVEGLCVRLLVFWKIGTKWKNLLRHCLYHIFETAGKASELQDHARFCIENIASDLCVKNTKQLFQYFQTQLLYTFLESEPLANIPFNVFGFTSLKNLVGDSQSEIVSQLIFRESDEKLKQLENILSKSTKDTIASHFGRAMAYAVAKDVSSASLSHNCESRIKAIVGKSYTSTIKTELATIIGHLFLRLEQEDQAEKIFSRSADYEYSKKILLDIQSNNRSSTQLPAGQEPSFRPKIVLDAIERLCRRVQKDVANIWTPQLFVKVARMLLKDINPVYGPTHACRNIQRFRILISLAGSTALTGYPLELIVHSIRPFVTDRYSADDALGIFQYVLHNGKSRFEENPPFIGGVCVVIFLSLKGFLQSTQDSTTQESQHKATLDKAKNFGAWLNEYILSLRLQKLDMELRKPFQMLVSLVQRVSDTGSSIDDTVEGRLLLMLLDEIREDGHVLDKHSTKTCFQLFLKKFLCASSVREDVLGDDEVAFSYVEPVYKSLSYPNLSQDYLIWAAGVLGRSYGHAGLLTSSISAETRLKTLPGLDLQSGNKQRQATSKSAIAQTLVALLQHENSQVVGFAEQALQHILNRHRNTEEAVIIQNCLPQSVLNTFMSKDYLPSLDVFEVSKGHLSLKEAFGNISVDSPEVWTRKLTSSFLAHGQDEPVLQALSPLVDGLDSLAQDLLPFVLHLLLLRRLDDDDFTNTIANGFNESFQNATQSEASHVKCLLNSVLYLRCQPRPQETIALERSEWIDVDYTKAAFAAKTCKMFKTAYMFLEIGNTIFERGVGRASITHSTQTQIPNSLLLEVFKDVDEPDSFYGVEQASDIDSIAQRLDYEGNDMESLLFRSAQADSFFRGNQDVAPSVSVEVIQSIAKLNLNTLTTSLVSGKANSLATQFSSKNIHSSAIKLRKWDLPMNYGDHDAGSILYRTLQTINGSSDPAQPKRAIQQGALQLLEQVTDQNWSGPSITQTFQALASLVEVSDLLEAQSLHGLTETWNALSKRDNWFEIRQFEQVSDFLRCREALAGMIRENITLQSTLRLNAKTSSRFDVMVNLQTSKAYRNLQASQDSLANVAYLSNQISSLTDQGLHVGAAVSEETANVLWDRGEFIASIRTLTSLTKDNRLDQEDISVGRAGLLATIAHHVSHARLEKPEDILDQYLRPALEQLKNSQSNTEAGKVHHEFATYCHKQLENPDHSNELVRVERLAKQRASEIPDLRIAIKNSKTDAERKMNSKELDGAQKWRDIYNTEVNRMTKARVEFMKSSLEHYLRSLSASDEFDTDIVRFVAIWLAHADDESANKSVQDYVASVATHKFCSLMNQLGSRLQENDTKFQAILGDLILRICKDHPYHGMYHVFAGSRTSGGHDSQAQSRKGGATRVARRLNRNNSTTSVWNAISKSNDLYSKMAKIKSEDAKMGAKLKMKQFEASQKVEQIVPTLQVPPITMNIDINHNFNYDDVPTVTSFNPTITIPSGISAPKILTTYASNGEQFKQLFKGGADDLRQDAIMEQVFSQVTSLLQSNKSTRQRGLKIRTYKVVPLDASSGAIEFVEPTISLNDYLSRAHELYNPKELKWRTCREHMMQAHDMDQDAKLRIFKNIKQRFSPVLRHFFFEHFEDPDEWFEKRLAYTRSTAAISILGHILGLGDRHCQNILLDTETGEVVHIDLGVAFEAGRILPKPETVPFRLTRDIVDGFGILRTEGVFRRCCEFTLEALRSNKDTILTLLNVLRYDPLYSWSVSPLRAKRLQNDQSVRPVEDQNQAGNTNLNGNNSKITASSGPAKAAAARRRSGAVQDHSPDEERNPDYNPNLRSNVNSQANGGEAERALSTVESKLGAGLSVSATVNELILQASDDKNLSALFHGWAPWA